MKKTILSIAAVALFVTTIVSCANEKKGTKDADSNSVAADTLKTDTTAVASTTSDVPSFSSDEVNKGLAEFNTLKDEYIAALKSKDSAKIQALGTKYATWAQGTATWSTKLKADEMQKYTDYMTKITKEWGEAAQAAVK